MVACVIASTDIRLNHFQMRNPYIHSYGTNQSILAGNNVPQSLETTDSDELFVGMRNVLGKDEVFEGSLAYGEINEFCSLYWYFKWMLTIDFK